MLVRACALVGAALGTAACSSKACIDITASSRLNYYDEQAHVVALYLFPLESDLAFHQASVSDLLRQEPIGGMVAPPLQMTITPGEEQEVVEDFGDRTEEIGIVADYYRAPGDPEGKRKTSVRARCGWFSDPSITLGPNNIERD